MSRRPTLAELLGVPREAAADPQREVTPAELLALSAERTLHVRLRLAAWREGWRACAETFAASEYARGRADADAEWMAALAPARAAAGRAATLPTFAELERRRWGPGGRAHFADPRPADHRGGPIAHDARDGAA